MSGSEKKECVILSPTAILGYGFPVRSFERGLEYNPDVIAVDAGSTDPGPYYLGSGKSFTDRASVKRDLRIMILAALERSIPVIVGTAGGSGSAEHLRWTVEIVKEILCEHNVTARVAQIPADIPKEYVLKALAEDRIQPLPGVPQIERSLIEGSRRIVAQMGIEPFLTALDEGYDIILAGRAYDPACFAALPVYRGFDIGLALHAGKILECAAIAASPGSGSDCVVAILNQDSFQLRTLSEERRFTAESTCAHTLYEKSDPYHLYGPGGMIDLEASSFIEDEEGVVVRGSRFRGSERYTIKIEAVSSCGFRTFFIAGVRDPILIARIEKVLKQVEARVRTIAPELFDTSSINSHIYGKHGVMGQLEPSKQTVPHEIALLVSVVSEDQQKADSLCSLYRSTLLHYGYEGRISTAGNLAFPFSPSDTPSGEVFEFSLYHLIEIDRKELAELFPLQEVRL